MPEAIHITAIHEKWRFECLATERYGAEQGHTNWFPIDGVFRCHGCAELARNDPSIDPEYSRLRDKKTGSVIGRENIVLDVSHGATAKGV